MFFKICQVLQMFFYFSEDPYFLGETGVNSCTTGLEITNKTECEAACNYLELPLKTMTDGQTCFKAGNGDCKQNNNHGASASFVCKAQGNKLPNTICLKFYILYIEFYSCSSSNFKFCRDEH